MNLSLDQKVEKAIRFLCKWMPEAEKMKKPIFLHSVRVGLYLQKNGYSESIILAGILHDILEDTKVEESELREMFGGTVFDIVKANTKDTSIANSDQQIEELINRCAQFGRNALIVKTADVLDNYNYYLKINSKKELEYCRQNIIAIKNNLSESFDNPIFETIKAINL